MRQHNLLSKQPFGTGIILCFLVGSIDGKHHFIIHDLSSFLTEQDKRPSLCGYFFILGLVTIRIICLITVRFTGLITICILCLTINRSNFIYHAKQIVA